MVVAVAFYVVIVATLSGLWRVAVDANGGDLAGYSAVALTWYIITSEAAIVSVNAKHIEDIGNDIAQGTVAVEMLRPASVLGIRMATQVGRGLPAGRGAVGRRCHRRHDRGRRPAASRRRSSSRRRAWCSPSPPTSSPSTRWRRCAFWIRDAGSIWFLYMKAVFILGGMIIPLELLPDGLAALRHAPARSGPWPTRRRAWRRATGSRGSWSSRSFWIGALAVVRDRSPSAPASADSRWSADERPAGRRVATPSPRWRPSRARSRVQMLIMAINDFVWVIFWVLFFDRVGTLGGWDRDSIILLQAVLTTAGGLSLGLFANARHDRHDGRRRRPRRRARAPGVAAAVRARCAASSR